MLTKITAAFAGIVIATISSGGYLGIVALMAIESAYMPIPSEIIMSFSGYLVSTGRFELLLVATAGAVGCNAGSTLAYIVGRYDGRRAIAKSVDYILMNRRDLEVTDQLFARFGGIAALFGRLLPDRPHIYRPISRDCPSAATQVSDIHLHRLVAVMFRSRLYRVQVGRAVEQ